MEAISIIISTMASRTDKYQLRTAYESAKRMLSHKNDEILIIDDSGLDNISKDNLDKYYEDYDSDIKSGILRIIYHPVNLSLLRSRMTGIIHSNNNYLLFLDCDDYFINQYEFLRVREFINDPDTLYYFHQYPNYYSTTDSCNNDTKHKLAVASGLQKITLWGRVIPRKVAIRTYNDIINYFGDEVYFNLREDYVASITMLKYYDKVVDLSQLPMIHYSGGHMCLGGKVTKEKYDELQKLKSTIIEYSNKILNDIDLSNNDRELLMNASRFSQERLFNYFELDGE